MRFLLALFLILTRPIFAAKVKAPLFGLGASGKLGGALVYGVWKGINTVRTYVIPANPNTADQQTQRGHLEDSVDEWHAAAYNAMDIGAWNRLATIAAKAMSGFNRMVREFIAEERPGGTWTRINLMEVAGVSSTGFVSRVYCGVGQPSFRYGLTPTYMPSTVGVIPAGPANQFEADLGGALVANTGYYYYWYYGTAETDYGRTGIGYQKTDA